MSNYRGFIVDFKDLGESIEIENGFVFGDFVHGNDDFDFIVGKILESNEEEATPEWWQAINKGNAERNTGLNDKNGNSIFEGDILKVKNNYGKVIFHFGNFKITELSNKTYDLNTVNLFSKIVGNIHQNPELLEENNE